MVEENTQREHWKPGPYWLRSVDVDRHPGMDGKLETLGDIPSTAIVVSGGGGWHVWLRLPEGMQKPPREKYQELPDIQVLSVGKYVVLPPSLHPSGKRYEGDRGTWRTSTTLARHPDPGAKPYHPVAIPNHPVAKPYHRP